MRIARLTTVIAALGLLATGQASALTLMGKDVECETKADAESGQTHRYCDVGQVLAFDGSPIDVSVTLPQAPAEGPDGRYPLMMMFHGWGGSKLTYGAQQKWAREGYAVFSISDRGWGNSCGMQYSKQPECLEGYNHLLDFRYEVRDAQELAALLASSSIDTETVVLEPAGNGDKDKPNKKDKPKKDDAPPTVTREVPLIDVARIGAIGSSYGGGMSVAIATLRDRIMNTDGSFMPWQTADGTPIRLAAAAPDITWSDLAYALMPNGRMLDYTVENDYGSRVGVMKLSYVSGFFALGLAGSNYAIPGQNPDADLITWYSFLAAGEPYDVDPMAAHIIEQVTNFHSTYYLPFTEDGPAPMIFSNGWSDDIFPSDEAIRNYNRIRAAFPETPVSLFFSSHGHARSLKLEGDNIRRDQSITEWLNYYVRDLALPEAARGAAPATGVEILATECFRDGTTDKNAMSEYHRADSWAELARGEVVLSDADLQVIPPQVQNPYKGQTYDAIAGQGVCAQPEGPGNMEPAAVSYTLPVVEAGGDYLLAGSPTVIADILSPGPHNQIAARLIDVAPDGTETLVARGVYRPRTPIIEGEPDFERQVFQLHPQAWRFLPGHYAKLELLAAEPPVTRPTNGQTPVSVQNLELRLPVLDAPDGVVVQERAALVVPEGRTLAPGFAAE